jgi:hypothetical protein
MEPEYNFKPGDVVFQLNNERRRLYLIVGEGNENYTILVVNLLTFTGLFGTVCLPGKRINVSKKTLAENYTKFLTDEQRISLEMSNV